MLTVIAGLPLLHLIVLAYRANQPVLLHGFHGLGKSALTAEAAARLGIDFIVVDLSVMEPTDLIGVPRVSEDGRTAYAAPSFLPGRGAGILMLEELNRCPRYMQAPCLQLLTARRLHEYRLPEGWIPCAAVNDAADGYLAEDLDPALLSRFLRVRVVPDAAAWLAWAGANGIHEAVVRFVADSPGVFEDSAANPRAWHYASNLLAAWEAGERQKDCLTAALAGVIGEKWAVAFLQFYFDPRRPLQPAEILSAYHAHRAALRGWARQSRLDLVKASVELLQAHLQPQRVYDAVVADASSKGNAEQFFADLPAELQRQVRAWLKERGFTGLAVARQNARTEP